jgi:hypothetical protein
MSINEVKAFHKCMAGTRTYKYMRNILEQALAYYMCTNDMKKTDRKIADSRRKNMVDPDWDVKGGIEDGTANGHIIDVGCGAKMYACERNEVRRKAGSVQQTYGV